MSYEPIHQKYRPQTFAQLVGQEAIATTLTNAITSQRIAPAYLFTGPRGTGKTSSARILAKSLNCLNSPSPTPQPCGNCEVCQAIARGSALDVIEIDAASNTGVDNIREIIERSQFAPVQCRYKVYVIDECHMLSTAAFNALLKTLEEPPDRVIFVLATTDPQRVLPTIISRCQRFDYRRIPLEAMVSHLRSIANQENIEIEEEAIRLVAQIANGGLRDAESLLDQLSLLTGTITPEKVWDLVGAVPEKDLVKLLEAIATEHHTFLLQQCRDIMNRGREPLVVLQNLANFYLNLLIAKTSPDRSDLVQVTSPTWQELTNLAPEWDINKILLGQQHLKNSETQLKNTTQPRLWLEVTLLGLLSLNQPSPQPLTIPAITQPQPQVKAAAKTSTGLIRNIYTDGSCIGNPGPGGWAYVINFNDGTAIENGGREADTTNNRMELQAAIAALEYVKKLGQQEPITIYSDSKYVIQGITEWVRGWKHREWQTSEKKPVINQDLWQRLDQLNSSQIKWKYVKAHSGIPGNERCDQLAKDYAHQNSQRLNPPIQAVENHQPITTTIDNNQESSEEQIWQQVLNYIQPNTTQTLLRQQCFLLSFTGSLACVGVRSKALLKMAQDKLSNIQAAFDLVCQRKIKIDLQVGKPSQIKTEEKPKAINQLSQPSQPSQPISTNIIPKKPVSLPPENKEEKPLEIIQPPVSQETGDIKEVAERLAKCFEGEIVNLADYDN